MTPQVPEYIVTFEAGIRPLVTAIALGLIWMGATRMEGPAQSRYTTAGALSVVFIALLAVAQYLGSANAYFATSENAVPTVLFGLLIPLMIAAVGVRLSGRIASLVSAIPLHWIVAAQAYRIAGGIFLVLWADGRMPWQFALPAGIGDVMTGCFAVVVAVLLAQKAPEAGYVFPPLGFYLMWRYQTWPVWLKTSITVAGSAMALAGSYISSTYVMPRVF